MSIVVAVKKNDQCVIASDSLTTQGSLKLSPDNKVNNCKLIQTDDCCIGLVGWSAIHNIFEHLVGTKSELFNFSTRIELFEKLLKIHKVLERKYNIETKEDDDQPVASSQLDGLIIKSNAIYEIGNYREVNEYSKFWAIGSGSKYALGSLHSTYDKFDAPLDIAKAAVEAACEYDDGCALPFFSVSSKDFLTK